MIKGDNYLFFPANIERRISRLQIITEYYSTYAVGQIARGCSNDNYRSTSKRKFAGYHFQERPKESVSDLVE